MAEKTAAWENPATTVIAEFMTGFPPKPPAQKLAFAYRIRMGYFDKIR